MFWVPVAAEAVNWSAWLWQQRQHFEPVLKSIGDFTAATLTNPDGAIRRVGNLIVFGQADAGPQILAFVEQTGQQLSVVERAVEGVHAGQAALSSSLGALQGLSMVTLGLTALTSGVLSVQFKALNRRLAVLVKSVADLHKKFDAAIIADLKAGLGLLQQGQDFLVAKDRGNAHDRLKAGLPYCLRTMKYFSELLGGHLNEKKVNCDEVRLLARHLAVAITGVASCQIGLEQDHHAFASSSQELALLQQASGWVFHNLVAGDPVPYLLPAMREDGVTIQFMAQLYQQAEDAGALKPRDNTSPEAWFEANRDALVRASLREPVIWSKKKWYDTLHKQLREAVSAIEETNRVLGLSRLVGQVRGSGQTTLAVMGQHMQKTFTLNAEECPYVAWGLA